MPREILPEIFDADRAASEFLIYQAEFPERNRKSKRIVTVQPSINNFLSNSFVWFNLEIEPYIPLDLYIMREYLLFKRNVTKACRNKGPV